MKTFDKIIDCFLSLIFISLLRMFCTPDVIFVRRRVGKAFARVCGVQDRVCGANCKTRRW